MSAPTPAWRRLWQPRNPLFWLVIALQVLSSALVLAIQLRDPPAALRLVLGLMALMNAVLGWWLLARLWREGGAAQAPAASQDAPGP